MPDNGKKSFVLYHDVRQPLELLTDEERGKLFLAILDYSEYDKVPDFDGALQMAFAFIKTGLDRDTAAWESKREKRREAGSLGGKQRVANQANATFAKQIKQTQANQAVPAPVPVNVPVPVSVKKDKAAKPPRAARFIPPTVEEVTAYVQERGSMVNPQGFIDFYASKGWMVGKSPMRDWKAACRNAEKWERWQRGGTRNEVKTAADYESGDDFFAR